MKSTVLLRHPKTKGEWACPTAAVEAWIAKGWEKVPAATAKAPAAPKATEKEK